MLKINAGKFKNHNIKMTNLETTRETSLMVRQAVFNLTNQFFDGGIALDLFAGSGAMGLEAYSRGMSKIYFNDLNPKALAIVKENAMSMKCLSDVVLLNLDYKDAIKKLEGLKFDVIFLDPPYKINDTGALLSLIAESDLLNDNGFISFEMDKKTIALEEVSKYRKIKERIYGIKKVVIYKE